MIKNFRDLVKELYKDAGEEQAIKKMNNLFVQKLKEVSDQEYNNNR